MRTKILLAAAAAMAAGIVASNAQVYSANIVGYVTVVSPGNLANSLICNPLDNGTNDLNSLVTAPNLSKVLVWNGTGFNSYSKTAGGWTGTPADPILKPGTAFFLEPKGANPVTNVFVGNVVAAPGGSVTNSLPGGLANSLVGPMIPFSDTLNGTNINLNAPNLSKVLIWTGTGFNSYSRSSGAWTGTPANPTITPGQGFFVEPKGASAFNWVETLSAN